MIQLLPSPLWKITQLLYKRYQSVHFLWKAFLQNGAENVNPHIHSFVCSFIFLPVTHNISADQIWMKLVEMMNVRQRNRGKVKRMSEGCGEQPVMWKMENKIKNTKMSSSWENKKQKKLHFFMLIIHSGLLTVSSENTVIRFRVIKM